MAGFSEMMSRVRGQRENQQRPQSRMSAPQPRAAQAQRRTVITADEAKQLEGFHNLLRYKALAHELGGELERANAEIAGLREQLRMSEHREARGMEERDQARREVTVMLTFFDSVFGQFSQMRKEVRSVRARVMPESVQPTADDVEAHFDQVDAEVQELLRNRRSENQQDGAEKPVAEQHVIDEPQAQVYGDQQPQEPKR